MNIFKTQTIPETDPPNVANETDRPSGLKVLGTGVLAAVAVGGMYAVAATFVNPTFGRISIPFLRSQTRHTEKVFKLLEGRKGTLVELGSGDGSFVLDAAKKGFHSTGYELNPWLVYYSRFKARRMGLHKMAAFHRKNLWKTDLTKYDNVVICGKELTMMRPLQGKLAKELRIGSCVVVSRTPFPDWMALTSVADDEDNELDSAWLYDRTSIDSSRFQLPVF